MTARRIVFDTHGNERQKECCRAWADPIVTDIVYGGSKGGAKSYTGCALIWGDALTYPGTHYFIARKTGTDLTKFTIPSINEVLRDFGISSAMYKFNGQDNFYTLYNGSRIYLLAAKYLPSDPEYQRFGSMQMTRGWIEEAGEFDTDAKRNLQISVGRWKNDDYGLTGKLLQTCNPSKNYLYREYYRPFKDGTLPPYVRFIQAMPQDNKRLASGYLEHLQRTLTGTQKQRLLLGNWEYDGDPAALIEYDNIINLFNNDHVLPTGQRYITADIAGMGSDRFVIAVWYGWVLVELQVIAKSDGKEIVHAIQAQRQKHGIKPQNVVFDADGIGGGVTGHISGALSFLNGSKALPYKGNDENYQNLKSQCSFHLADAVNAGSMYFSAPVEEKVRQDLIEELEQVKRGEVTDGKLRVISKDAVKEALGRSPDLSDVMMMRVFFELDHSKRLPRML